MKTRAAILKFVILFILAIMALCALAHTGSAAGLDTGPTPTRPPRDTPAPALFPAPTNTPPGPAATIVPTPTPPTFTLPLPLPLPTMTITCLPGWVCDVIVDPNGSESFLVLAVDAEYLGWWESIVMPGKWGMRLWFEPPVCAGNVSTVRLIDAGGGSVEVARERLGEFCAFVPVVSKERGK